VGRAHHERVSNVHLMRVDAALREAVAQADDKEFAIVEGDRHPSGFDGPLPIAQRTVQNLASLGWR
jgi:hypothetical protein